MIFSFWIIFDFVQKFEVFLPNKNGKKMLPQKMHNVLERIFGFMSFLFLCDFYSYDEFCILPL